MKGRESFLKLLWLILSFSLLILCLCIGYELGQGRRNSAIALACMAVISIFTWWILLPGKK